MSNARRTALASSCVLAIAAFLLGGGSTATAVTTEDPPADLAFEDSSITITYGDWLVVDFTAAGWVGDFSPESESDPDYNPIILVGTGFPDDFTTEGDFSFNHVHSRTEGIVYQASSRPLEAGSYTAKLRFTHTDESSNPVTQESASATITVVPAALDVEFAATPDATSTSNLILSAEFTGTFADNFASEDFKNSPLAPKGVWHYAITDSSGAVVAEQDVTADGTLGSSWYWTGAIPGQDYTSSVTFESATATDADFAVNQADAIAFTGAASPRPEPTSTAPPAPATTAAPAVGFTLPLWVIVVISLVIAGLLTSSIVLLVRYNRASTPTEGAGHVA